MAENQAIALFRKTWGTYRKLVFNNYMFHTNMFAAFRQTVTPLCAERPITILDLGCGDASEMAKSLSSLGGRRVVSNYLGCDLSEPALELARQNMTAPKTSSFLCRDMLEVLRGEQESSWDVLVSSYSLHHLTSAQKQSFFVHAGRVLNKTSGQLVLIDTMREEEESREAYLEAYLTEMKRGWAMMTPEELQVIEDHVRGFDFPEKSSTYLEMAKKAGLKTSKQIAKQSWHHAWSYGFNDKK